MDSASDGDAVLHRQMRQQEAVADLGQRALEADDLDRLLEEASATVAETLEVEYATVLERRPDEMPALQQGVGWRDGRISSATVPVDPGSQVGYTLVSAEPIVVEDLREETRFSGSELLADHGVVGGITVTIGPAENPWGVLGAHATEERAFTRHDADFLERVADVLASAIEREERRTELAEIHGRISDAFFALNEDWEFTYLNDRARELITPDDRDLIGDSVWEAFPAAEHREFRPFYGRAMTDNETVSFEEYYPEPLDRWFEVRAYPSETGLSVYFRDVTERKERERELALFRNLVDHSTDSMFVVEPETGEFLDVNETACRRRGYDRDELLELSVPDIETELPDSDAWESFLEELRTEGRSTFEGTHTRTDGTTFPVEINVSYVELDREYVFAIARDVTEHRRRERRLAQSEQRYRALAESFPNGIVALFDDEFEITLAAGRAFDALPVDVDDFEGSHVREVLDDPLSDALEPSLRAALEGAEDTVELEYADRNWWVHTVPVTDEDEDVVAGMAMAQDVTEQRERERYLQEAKSRLEAAIDAGAIGTWEWDILEDRIVTGPSFARQFGVDPDAAREGVSLETFVSSIHEDDRERVERRIEETIETGEAYEAEYRVRNADDEIRWVVARGHVEYDDDGTPVTFHGALIDITERKRTEAKLEEQREQLETLFEVLPVGVVVAEPDGGLIEANDAAAELWGGDVFDAETVADYERYDGWWADTGDPVAPDEWTMSRVLDGETVLDPDIFEIEAADGERRTVMIHGMPIRDDSGEVVRGVLTQTDVTERREYRRKLEASNERLEQFAYAVSHDLQEPLRMVTSYLGLIESRYADELDADAEEFIDYAVDGAERMREMIDGLLAYSRVETQGEPFEAVELEVVLEDVLADLQLRIEETDAELTIEPLPCIEGDRGQLRQVFQNLLENAITYSGEEPPRIHVDAERDGSEWIVSVHDEGIGIAPDDQDRIFEVFQRLHGNGEHDGTGIGLALCRRIVERHDGEIRMDSEPREGSTFSVILPATNER